MRIQELERLVKTDRATIRYYEKEGLITPNRSENGYRDYTEENALELKRILLLRQLGVSIFTISQLQKGSADFHEVMKQQIETLTQQIGSRKRARALCEVMKSDGVSYEKMDADHYLRLLEEIPMDEPVGQNNGFQEKVAKEIHPWRRFFARWFDFSLAAMLIDFLIVVVLRIRPLPGNLLDAVIVVITAILFVPIEGYVLSEFGTTLGKYAMGIRIDSVNGGKLSRKDATERAWLVLRDGACFYIPILYIWSIVRSYLQLTGRTFRRFARKEDIPEPDEMSWDDKTEIVYQSLDRMRGVVLVAMIGVLIIFSVIIGVDSIKPRYRGSELTIAQFAKNYNQYVKIVNPNADQYDLLQSDGTWKPQPNAIASISIETGDFYVPEGFIFETENGLIKSIRLERSWDNANFVRPMNSEAVCLAFSVLLGQKGFSLKELTDFAEIMDENSGVAEGTIAYGDAVRITWTVQSENYLCQDGTYYIMDPEKDASLVYEFMVTFQ